LDHPTYEASKSVIDSSLRGAGFLDAKFTKKRVVVKPEEHSAQVDLQWESGPRYKFGDVRFAGDAPFPEGFLRDFVPWREDAFFNSEQVLNLQQRLVDADYFELVSVQPAFDEKKDGTVPHRRVVEARSAHRLFGRGVLQHRFRRGCAPRRRTPLGSTRKATRPT
jgi:translocation and assembly module TamA